MQTYRMYTTIGIRQVKSRIVVFPFSFSFSFSYVLINLFICIVLLLLLSGNILAIVIKGSVCKGLDERKGRKLE